MLGESSTSADEVFRHMDGIDHLWAGGVLMHMSETLWEQMNGTATAKGLGDLDYRYIRDGRLLGVRAHHWNEQGRSHGQLQQVHLAAMGGEDPWRSLVPGATIGNTDMLRGPVESITVGKTLTIGEKYRNRNRDGSA